MKQIVAEKILEAAEVIGLDLTLDTGYSGRGMYGKTTSSITGDQNDFMQALAYAAATVKEEENDPTTYDEEGDPVITLDEFIEEIASMRSDNMGRSNLVWY